MSSDPNLSAQSVSSFSSSTTSCKSPIATAFSAVKRSPVRKYRRACAGDMRGTTYGEMVAGMRPRRTSDSEKVAERTPTAMSHAQISPTPPPNALPCTSATVAHGKSASFWSIRESWSASASFSSGESRAAARIQLRSPPAQKLRPSARTNSARSPSAARRPSSVAERELIISMLKALCTLGRARVSSKKPGRRASGRNV
mmetsp:Transcript_22576/g.68835  ORF Transcript_22576/g.68835 Transcript_22576/m.68835 type:complete len:200 (+) Transcript_22576:557-1156(+)|eukprot:scaffold132447_cov33-Tisochrysis_lutea.AAC.6